MNVKTLLRIATLLTTFYSTNVYAQNNLQQLDHNKMIKGMKVVNMQEADGPDPRDPSNENVRIRIVRVYRYSIDEKTYAEKGEAEITLTYRICNNKPLQTPFSVYDHNSNVIYLLDTNDGVQGTIPRIRDVIQNGGMYLVTDLMPPCSFSPSELAQNNENLDNKLAEKQQEVPQALAQTASWIPELISVSWIPKIEKKS